MLLSWNMEAALRRVPTEREPEFNGGYAAAS
jgi:hypothetical protein